MLARPPRAAGIKGAKARFYDAKRTLDQGVTKAYVAALLAGYNEQVLADSARFMKREADIGQSRFSACDLSDSDLKQIQIGAEQFELQEAAAHAAAVQARIQVEILMGVRQPHGNWTPADTLEQMDGVIPPLPQAAAARPARMFSRPRRICAAANSTSSCKRRCGFPIPPFHFNTNTTRSRRGRRRMTLLVSAFHFRSRCGTSMAATSRRRRRQ